MGAGFAQLRDDTRVSCETPATTIRRTIGVLQVADVSLAGARSDFITLQVLTREHGVRADVVIRAMQQWRAQDQFLCSPSAIRCSASMRQGASGADPSTARRNSAIVVPLT